jgi:hypothetical protein
MTVYCPPIDSSIGLRGWSSSGASAEAKNVEELFDQWLNHYLESRLQSLIPEIENLRGVNDELSTPVDGETVSSALQFAYCLPRFGPIPEVSADPDGEISFDWIGPSGEMFSVSVNKQKRLAYAGWFGEGSRIHGIERLAKECPKQIVRGIEKTTR